ncbi:MAG: DUF1282 domain-containing protein [Brevundimonas sp.]|nr:MAG: DUF1282 domain-containing protein [Brevundimonas sp.]
MTDHAPIVSPSLAARVKGIILRPSPEWDVIDGEPATVKGLFSGYAMVLAAIGPIAGLIGGVVFGHSIIGSLLGALLGYAMALLSVLLIGIVIDALASSFGGVSNRTQAMKVAVYSSTPSWVAGAFGIIPPLGLIAAIVGGLYGLYVLYLGLPKLMKAPQDKAVIYTIVVVLIAIVISWIALLITGAVVASFVVAGAMATGGL